MPCVAANVSCAFECRASRNLEIDSGFGKSAEEIAVSDKRTDQRGQQPEQKHPQVTPAQKTSG